eukprot:2858793-Rhodomonas_salina.1
MHTMSAQRSCITVSSALMHTRPWPSHNPRPRTGHRVAGMHEDTGAAKATATLLVMRACRCKW